MQRRPEKISSLEVDRGLYVLRYAGAATADAPVIYVRPSPGSDDHITIIAVPGEPAGRLSAPGGLSVIVVEEDAILQITAQATSVGGSLQAEVRLEPLHQTAAPPVVALPRPVAAAPPPIEQSFGATKDFRVLAHVSRRGDVEGDEGAWIGGPDAPAPIEGVSLQCAPHIGAVQYQVMISGDSRWSDWLADGSFGGSRGRAKPLTGMRIRFAPAGGNDVTIEGEALFLGSAIVSREGHEIEFRSAAGLDPLVGIRLRLKRASPAAATRPGVVAAGVPSGRVRVFKASSVRRSG